MFAVVTAEHGLFMETYESDGIVSGEVDGA